MSRNRWILVAATAFVALGLALPDAADAGWRRRCCRGDRGCCGVTYANPCNTGCCGLSDIGFRGRYTVAYAGNSCCGVTAGHTMSSGQMQQGSHYGLESGGGQTFVPPAPSGAGAGGQSQGAIPAPPAPNR